MRGLGTSLSARIVLAALATGVVAALVSAAISFVVVNRVVDVQARTALHARVTAIAALPADRARSLTRLVIARERFAFVDRDGTADGSAAQVLGPRLLELVGRGRALSRTVALPGGEVILESAPSRSGGGVVAVRPVADVRATNAVFLRGLLLALLAGVVAAVVAGLLAGRRLGRPLASLASDARRLARGERRLAITPQPVPEIDDIASALHTLDTALATSEERQREFLLSISHELRTPLTALRGYAEALADGVVPPDDVADVGRTLVSESERLGRFTSDLLELARLEAEDFRIDSAPLRLDEVVHEARRAWQGAADRAGVVLDARAPELVVETDRQRLRQLVDGLVENALRITPAGGGVRIHGVDGGAAATWGVEVTDDGPGLDDADLAVAFERGMLHERYRDERPVGSGLGLSIARRLVARLGGRISASRASGGGTTVRAEFPRASPPSDSEALREPDSGSTAG